ncbi:MAG: site-specific DNA-methyltransferase [Truepera sp.]|nr:site-specific DNA-methyltransferase [Truepera sp.]
MNRLYYGDCLTIMRDHMGAESVDLIYLDPPFNSNREYNAIYKDETGRPLPDQIEAFCDLWELDEERERAIRALPVLMQDQGIDDAVTQFWKVWVNALRNTQPRLLAYLSYMVERLLWMKVVLKPTGSVYLHCDPTASHYIKVMMDGVFDYNFRNEIIWKRTTSHNSGSQFGRIHDTILFYSHSRRRWTWNRTYASKYSDEQLSRFKRDDSGRLYKGDDLTAARPNSNSGKFEWRGTMPGKGRGWAYTREKLEEFWEAGRILTKADGTPRLDGLKSYLDELPGPRTQSIWDDIPRIPNTSKERLGYATQKPVALLERIIKASSNPGDVVFDPFCGCATTLEAAHKLGRQWIGVDIAIHAVKRVAAIRLRDRLGLEEGRDFTIEGVPHSLEGAQHLWERDKYHFQKWAVEQVDGFVTSKRTADGGIDGRLYFAPPDEHGPISLGGRGELQSMAIEVKGGKNVSINDLRALRGVLDSDVAVMAGLIIMESLGPTKERHFRTFMADAGDLDVLGMKYARMQMLTVEEILEGKRFETPGAVAGKGLAQQKILSPH